MTTPHPKRTKADIGTGATFAMTLRSLPGQSVPTELRLRKALKLLLRSAGFEAVDVRQVVVEVESEVVSVESPRRLATRMEPAPGPEGPAPFSLHQSDAEGRSAPDPIQDTTGAEKRASVAAMRNGGHCNGCITRHRHKKRTSAMAGPH